MATKNVEIRVGLLIIAGVIILVAMILWIQGYRFGQEYRPVKAVFGEVGSLSKGDPVMVSGIRMGKVKNLELHESGVLVTMTISNEVVLKEDARFTIKNIGLMGERFVAVKQGISENLLDITVPAVGDYDTGIPEAMGMMGEMVTELRNLVIAIKSSIASDENLDKLTTAVSNFEGLSKSLTDYFDRNRNNFDKTAENFLATSKGLKNLVSGSTGKVDSTLVRVEDISRRLDTVVTDLEMMSKAAREFADNLNTGDGTIQMLVDDRRLYDDLRKTASNLDALINDIRENPKKYIDLKVELF